jgi:hypothetical protein
VAEKQTTQEQAARRIQGILALAEDSAKRGDLLKRDQYLQKATALQHQYAIDQILLERNDSTVVDELSFQDFCTESNTPLIKAKRDLICGVARVFRGVPLMLDTTRWVNGQWKRDKRAAIRVHAHASDMVLIAQMYTSLLLQMQAEMAHDEKLTHEKVTNGWRVSYAHACVDRVVYRLGQLHRERDRAEAATGSGMDIVLRDKAALVQAYLEDEKLVKGKGRRLPRSDRNAHGRAAGDAAGRRADLGQKRVTEPTTPAIDRV